MDWKDYREMPDEGMFEKIQGRLRRRRLMRAGATAAVVLLVGGAVVWAVVPSQRVEADAVAEVQKVDAGETPALQEALAPTATSIFEQQQSPKAKKSEYSEYSEEHSDVAEKAPVAVAAETPAVQKKSDYSDYSEYSEPSYVAKKAPVAVAAETPAVQKKSEHSEYSEYSESSENTPTQAAAPAASPAKPSPVVGDTANLVLWVPNIIVPSGDVDDNRTFRIIFTKQVTDFHLYIYNRNGRLVHSSTDVAEEWDATYHGSLLPQGAYVWVSTYRDTEGRPHQSKGTVTVVR